MSNQHNLVRAREVKAAVALLVFMSAVLVGLLVASPVGASHGLPVGATYGVADAHNGPGDPGLDVSAPAFPDSKAFWMGVCDLEDPSAVVGIAPAIRGDCIDHGTAYEVPFGNNPIPPRQTTWEPGEEPSWRLAAATQAGGHPDVTATFWLQRWSHSPTENGSSHTVAPDGDTEDVIVRLPAGFIGNPNAVPQCPAELLQLSPPLCPPETQIGVSTVTLGEGGGGAPTNSRVPVWNVEPREGKLAEFMISANINVSTKVNIPIVARARTEGDFGIDTMAINLPSGLPMLGQTITLWGVPWDESHDKFRPPVNYIGNGQQGIPETGLPDEQGTQPVGYRPEWGAVRSFISQMTECDPASAPVFRMDLASWHRPDEVFAYQSQLGGPISGCERVPFDPVMDIAPTSAMADSPSGLQVDLTVPQNLDPRDPSGELLEAPGPGAGPGEVAGYLAAASEYWASDQGLSSAHLKDAVVRLPQGLSLNPAVAAGLQGCSDAAVGVTSAGSPPLFDNVDPFDKTLPGGQRCPEGSKIGTVEVYSPVLPAGPGDVAGEANLTGDVVIGMPRSTDPMSGEMFRLFLVVRSEERGLVAKIAGSATADPQTGQLTTRFVQNPRVPFETLRLRLKGGQRAALATAQTCGPQPWSGLLTPWTAAHAAGGVADPVGGAFGPTSGCVRGFSPSLVAGMSSTRAGGSGTFSFSFSRDDGEQWVRGVSVKLPAGLLANVGSVELCEGARAATGSCPPESRVGTVDAGAGAGQPFFLERKGSAYLTEGYKGAPYGLVTVVPVEAGPFRGKFALDPIVVRQALYVDPRTAKVSAVSDPFPVIHHGIPLRIRSVTLLMDRPGFMRNPTSCATKEIAATFVSTENASADASYPFNASGCKKLRFAPKLSLRLTGSKQTRTHGHPGIRATVTQKPGEAAIRRADVRLPKALVLDEANARALCSFEDGTKPDLEERCPKGSIVGRARAVSPLLARPLAGKVFFVKRARIDPTTGQSIRSLPMIVVALRGEIAINLYGRSAVKGGRLGNVFKMVPDAPIRRFSLNITGGKNGILEITANRRGNINICHHTQTAEARLDAHNGKHHDREITVKTPCKNKKNKKRKRR